MLTQEQLQQIENLCLSEGVYFYDVRMEMVDHIGQGIEDKLERDPDTKFGEALKDIGMNLGVYGFRHIVEQKEEQVRKNVRKQQLKIFWQFFTWPKILATLLLFTLLISPYYILGLSPKANVSINYILILAASIIGLMYVPLQFKKSAEPLLSLQPLNRFQWVFGLLQFSYLPTTITNMFDEESKSTTLFAMSFSLFSTLLILLSFAGFTVYKNIYNKARTNYPLAFK